jgi:hypothetical protein
MAREKKAQYLWERACSRLDRCAATDTPCRDYREQARSHRFSGLAPRTYKGMLNASNRVYDA